jgi:hypothetical protein
MSLTHLVHDREVRRLMQPLLPTRPIRLRLRLKVPPGRMSGGLVGTAFDYAARFELQRRYPHARVARWVAEGALDAVRFLLVAGNVGGSGIVSRSVTQDGEILSEIDSEMAARWKTIIQAARKSVGSYIHDPSPSSAMQDDIFKHALRLARIDPYYRCLAVDPEPEYIDPRDLADIRALFAIAPWQMLGSEDPLWLNPEFGAQSLRVGGADADLITGDRLLDLKTTKNALARGSLRQLLGYMVLARAARRYERAFPTIRSVGVYYARHGRLWLLPTSQFTDQPAFKAFEKGFFKRAEEIFGKFRRRPEAQSKPRTLRTSSDK